MSTTTLLLDDLAARLPDLLVRDEAELGRRLARTRRQGGAADELLGAVEAAEARVAARRATVPRPSYPEGLPVSERKDELVAAIRDHQVVIVAGETGSGKSTQLPKICLEAGRGVRGLIGHTQPRRLAARTVAERVAEELGGSVGEVVGYTVRFTDRVSDSTLVKVMTDGILLNELQRDRTLSRYDTLIVDEAHERSLNIDFILGYLKQLLPARPDLKVVVTSATIDTERFAAHFDGAPVVEVTGRSYPVEVRYRPMGEDPEDDRDQVQAVIDAVDELADESPGDVLVFLSGEREIRDTAVALGKRNLRNTEVVPLYARLSSAEQHRVFQPHTGRRIVLATNVAETSLTVPGIRYVVDPGTARISRFNRRTKVQRLPIEAISQASANQRAGRCGRVAPGICIRLYAEDDFDSRPEFTEPEVLRTNLASVILQMTAIGLGDIAGFPFVEPPDERSIGDGVALLEELGAFRDEDEHRHDDRSARRLSPLGRTLAQLPLDPRLGRMVVEAEHRGCVAEVLVIASALSIQDPRERPTGKEQAAAESHARFADDRSDFVSFVNLWTYLRAQQKERTSSGFRRMCRTEHLNYLRVREWQDVHTQLRQVLRGLKIKPNAAPANHDDIHRALLAGLLSHVGMKVATREGPRHELLGARNARFAIAPGSVLFKSTPAWVMVAELVETNRLWGRVAAPLDPAWAEELGEHLVKRSYGDPWWDAKRGVAMVHERVTLYGLPVVTERRVPFSRVDPVGARDLFLDHALVQGEWRTHHTFVAANHALVDQVGALEDRVRRHDILVGEHERFAFFDERVGPDVTSTRHFDRWWKRARDTRPELLSFTVEDLVDPDAGDVSPTAYPDTWLQDGRALALSYRFDPTSDLDGVTVDVPLPVMAEVDGTGFDWHVPGLRTELVTALVRLLPKSLRRQIGAVGDQARAFLAEASPADGALTEVLARWLSRTTGERVQAGDWQLDRLPGHLRITFRIVSERGTPLAWSKDLPALRRHLQTKLTASVSGAANGFERTGLTTWSLGTLPRSVETATGGHRITTYPALVDEGTAAGVQAFASVEEQRQAMWTGTRRLLQLTVGSPLPAVQRLLRNETKLGLAAAPYATVADVLDDCVTCALDHVLAAAGGPAWDEAGYAALHGAVRDDLVDTTLDVAVLVGRILTQARDVERRIADLTAAPLQPALTDVAVQVARLVHPGFVATTGRDRLGHLPRYLGAIGIRLDKLVKDPHRDRAAMLNVQSVEAEVQVLRSRSTDAALVALRWQVEELRVSLFAQSLGTEGPVSEQRIRKELANLR